MMGDDVLHTVHIDAQYIVFLLEALGCSQKIIFSLLNDPLWLFVLKRLCVCT